MDLEQAKKVVKNAEEIKRISDLLEKGFIRHDEDFNWRDRRFIIEGNFRQGCNVCKVQKRMFDAQNEGIRKLEAVLQETAKEIIADLEKENQAILGE